jgi:hypothetical protein
MSPCDVWNVIQVLFRHDRAMHVGMANCPVHGVSRAAVIGPAFMPGTNRPCELSSPVHGAYPRGWLQPWKPRKTGLGQGRGSWACQPGVNAGPNTASRKRPVNGATTRRDAAELRNKNGLRDIPRFRPKRQSFAQAKSDLSNRRSPI